MSDLPPTTAPGQVYGAQAEQRRAQEAVPMGPQSPLGRLPPSLMGPSANPAEPVQAGLPSGPGPGREALNMPEVEQVTSATLRRLYRKYPSRSLRRMIERADRGY